VRWLDRLLRRPPVPDWLRRELQDDEYVLASAHVDPAVVDPAGPSDAMLVATSHGIWLPDRRRVGWHLVSKATWSDGTLGLVEAVADPVEGSDRAAVLSDLPVRRFRLAGPGKLPQTVHQRVEASILSRHRRDLADGGVWLVQRKVPGRGTPQLQVRPDPGTDDAAVRHIAVEVTRGIGLDR